MRKTSKASVAYKGVRIEPRGSVGLKAQLVLTADLRRQGKLCITFMSFGIDFSIERVFDFDEYTKLLVGERSHLLTSKVIWLRLFAPKPADDECILWYFFTEAFVLS